MRSAGGRTIAKAKELRPGMIVQKISAGYGLTMGRDYIVAHVERAADAFDRARGEVATARSRAAAAEVARDMIVAHDAIRYEGREALLIAFAGRFGRPVAFAASDEVRYVGRSTQAMPDAAVA